MKRISLIIAILFSMMLFACEQSPKLNEIIDNKEVEMVKGTGYDRSIMLTELGYDEETILSIHNERKSTWKVENPEIVQINGSIVIGLSSGTTNVIVEGINTKITIKITVEELDYFDGLYIRMTVGDVVNIEKLLNSYPIEVTNVEFEMDEIYYKDYNILALKKSETNIKVFFELSDEGYIAIPIIIDCKNDYLDAHSYIVNQIFNKINDYRDFEPVVTFTKEYIYKIINEQEEEEIEKLYDEFLVKYDELLVELDKNYQTYVEDFIEKFNSKFGSYKDDEIVANAINAHKDSLQMLSSCLYDAVKYNRMYILKAREHLLSNKSYYEVEKSIAINNINEYYENHKNCEGATEIKDKWINQINEANNTNSELVETIWEYDEACIDEFEKNHYIINNKEALKQRYLSYMASRYDQFVNTEKVENAKEICCKYFDKVLESKTYEEFKKLYDEFQEELEDAYHNSDSYINKYKEEIKNNIEIMYEEFCNLYPDLSDKYTDMRNLCDEYIAKVDASIDSIILENLYTEFQEKYYNYINGLFD